MKVIFHYSRHTEWVHTQNPSSQPKKKIKIWSPRSINSVESKNPTLDYRYLHSGISKVTKCAYNSSILCKLHVVTKSSKVTSQTRINTWSALSKWLSSSLASARSLHRQISMKACELVWRNKNIPFNYLSHRRLIHPLLWWQLKINLMWLIKTLEVQRSNLRDLKRLWKCLCWTQRNSLNWVLTHLRECYFLDLLEQGKHWLRELLQIGQMHALLESLDQSSCRDMSEKVREWLEKYSS